MSVSSYTSFPQQDVENSSSTVRIKTSNDSYYKETTRIESQLSTGRKVVEAVKGIFYGLALLPSLFGIGDAPTVVGQRMLNSFKAAHYGEKKTVKSEPISEDEARAQNLDLPEKKVVVGALRDFRGDAFHVTKHTKGLSSAARVGHLFAAVGEAVLAPLSGNLKPHLTEAKRHAKEWLTGTKEVKEYVRVPFEKSMTFKNAPYNPRDKASLWQYVNDHQHLLKETQEGHQYILDPQRSCIIFIPNGLNDQKEGSNSKICCLKFFNLYDGKSLTTVSDLEKTARAYMVAYDEIQKGIKEVDAEDILKGIIVIDFTHQMVRAYRDNDPNRRLGLWTGARIELDEAVWKEMNAFFDKERTKEKQNVSGDPVIKPKHHEKPDSDKKPAATSHIDDSLPQLDPQSPIISDIDESNSSLSD